MRPLGVLSVRLPVIPGLQVHERIGEQNLRLVVVGEGCRHLAHGVGVGGIERLTVGSRVGAVASCQGLDLGALDLAGGGAQGHRLGYGGEGGSDRLGLHRVVDVGPERPRLAPVAHGAGGIGLLRRPKRAHGLAMVEGVGPAHALVEPALRVRRARGDLDAERAQIVPQGWPGRGVGRLRRLRDGDEGAWLEELGLAVHGAAELPRDIGRVEQRTRGRHGVRRGQQRRGYGREADGGRS